MTLDNRARQRQNNRIKDGICYMLKIITAYLHMMIYTEVFKFINKGQPFLLHAHICPSTTHNPIQPYQFPYPSPPISHAFVPLLNPLFMPNPTLHHLPIIYPPARHYNQNIHPLPHPPPARHNPHMRQNPQLPVWPRCYLSLDELPKAGLQDVDMRTVLPEGIEHRVCEGGELRGVVGRAGF